MKIKKRTLIAALSLALAVFISYIAFLARSPVLVVVDESFIMLYGEKRAKSEISRSSLDLFRRVKPVPVADDTTEDIVLVAVNEASKRPDCVIFPLRFSRAARLLREQSPQIPVIILEGRYPEGATPSSFAIGYDANDYFIYKTDISADFYRAAQAAVILDRGKNGKTVIFTEQNTQTQASEAFSRVLNDMEMTIQTSFITNYSQFTATDDISCVVIAGSGSEYMDRHKDVPVVFFTWINPELLPFDTVLVFNDSPLAHAATAARMAKEGMTKGQILSKTTVLRGKDIDRATLRKLRKI
jgi:hypothetical protein